MTNKRAKAKLDFEENECRELLSDLQARVANPAQHNDPRGRVESLATAVFADKTVAFADAITLAQHYTESHVKKILKHPQHIPIYVRQVEGPSSDALLLFCRFVQKKWRAIAFLNSSFLLRESLETPEAFDLLSRFCAGPSSTRSAPPADNAADPERGGSEVAPSGEPHCGGNPEQPTGEPATRSPAQDTRSTLSRSPACLGSPPALDSGPLIGEDATQNELERTGDATHKRRRFDDETRQGRKRPTKHGDNGQTNHLLEGQAVLASELTSAPVLSPPASSDTPLSSHPPCLSSSPLIRTHPDNGVVPGAGHRAELAPQSVTRSPPEDTPSYRETNPQTLYTRSLVPAGAKGFPGSNCGLSTPTLRFSGDGLIKFKVGPQPDNLREMLSNFYVQSICPGRTILENTIYGNEVTASKESAAMQLAIIALSASYLKEYVGEPLRTKLANAEATATRNALRQARAAPAHDATWMILIHHAIVSPDLHDGHWTEYLYPLVHTPNRQSNVIIAAHSVWLMAFVPLETKYNFQRYDYHWLGNGDESELRTINCLLGLPRAMLYLQYMITVNAKTGVLDANMVRSIEECPAWLFPNTDVGSIANKTFHTYRLATLLYAYARGHRLPRRNALVASTVAQLVELLQMLPTSGKYYSALHPAFCFLIACACTQEMEQFWILRTIMEEIGLQNKSNVSDVVRVMDWIWEWNCDRVDGDGWWEKLARHLDEKMAGRPICVT